MNGVRRVSMPAMAVTVLAVVVLGAGMLYSYQGDVKPEVMEMQEYVKYSKSGRLQRATFALG